MFNKLFGSKPIENAGLESTPFFFITGFLQKDARFSKLKNIPDYLSDEKEGKIMENIDFS